MSVRAFVVRAVLVIAASVLAGAWSAGALAQGTTGRLLPRVYIFTEVAKPGQPALPGQEPRRASVDDLKEELRKKPDLLRVVDIPADADVLVEVLRRESVSGSRCLLVVRIRASGQSAGREFQGEAATWKEAATLVADAVRRWVNEMYEPACAPLHLPAAGGDAMRVLVPTSPVVGYDGGRPFSFPPRVGA